MKEKYSIQRQIAKQAEQGIKQFAVLIDPDHAPREHLMQLIDQATVSGVDYLFVGGSLMTTNGLDATIHTIRSATSIPVVLFPGSVMQISKEADALLFLSLVSGRNPELLIGSQVVAAPYLKASGLEVISTAYMLVDCGSATTASYISNTQPIPYNKAEIAATTALAAEYMGMQLTYLDGGSGAEKPVSDTMVKAVRAAVHTPLIVGGGITNVEKAKKVYEAGADLIVIGNALQKEPGLINGICALKQTMSKQRLTP
jgi:putative glycerol-1-phosphate prenyltransferase